MNQSELTGNQRFIITVGVLFSGATGLIYEIVWSRELRLVIGSTMEAITIILMVFMGGLAIGSYFLGKKCDGVANPLRMYIVIEVCIGLYGMASAYLFHPLSIFYLFLVKTGMSPGLLLFGRVIASFLVLVTPAVLMGGTLPVISRVWIRENEKIGAGISLLYGMNTLGAVAGAFAAGFIILPLMGMRSSLFLAGVINLSIALVFYTFIGLQKVAEKKNRKKHSGIEQVTADTERQEKVPMAQTWVLIASIGISGFSAMALEVAWTRILIQVIGSSVYAFSTVLTAYLLGIAAGSLLVGRFIKKIKNPVLFFGILQLVIFGAVFLATPALGILPVLFVKMVDSVYDDFGSLLFLDFTVALAVMIVPTVCMGMVFPLAISIISKSVRTLGENVGRIYGINTLGTILGSAAAGFLFIPLTGTRSTIMVAALCNLAAGIMVLIYSRHKRSGYSLLLIPLAVISIVYMPDWDKRLMITGPYIYADRLLKELKTGIFDDYIEEIKLVYFREGLDATVAIIENIKGNRFLRINGKVDASTDTGDMNTQVMLGHLPLFLHPDAKKTAVIGLGSGITCGSALTHPIESLDCIEISEDVIEGCKKAFGPFNNHIFQDPRFNIIRMDARHYFKITENNYDVIISEPSNPWITGVSSMFTRECFQQLKRGLASGGIVCQWLHYYNLDLEDLKMVLRTFGEVFPHTSLWSYVPGDMLLIGSTSSHSIDYDVVGSLLANDKINASLARVSMNSSIKLIAGYLIDRKALMEYTQFSRINTDDRPYLEFSAPRTLFRETSLKNIMDISKRFPVVVPPLTHLKHKVSKGTFYEHLNVVVNLPDGWKEQWAGIWVKRIIEKEKNDKNQEILKDIVWGTGRRIDYTFPDRLLIIEGLNKNEMETHALETSLLQRYTGNVERHGATIADEHPAYWACGLDDNRYVLSWTWFCPSNKTQMFCRLEMNTPVPDVAATLGELKTAISCFHK